MKKIRNLSSEYINGYYRSCAIFWCDFCKSEVKKNLSNGLRDISCGCIKGKLITEANKDNLYGYIHGSSRNKLYKVWNSMKQRILNPNSNRYKDYGGRGITICNEWLEFIPFRDWALSNGYQKGLQINRINNDGNYEPNNCNWITNKENNRNRGNQKIKNIETAYEIRSKYKTGNYTMKQLGEDYNTNKHHISQIIRNKIWKS